jgi:hypothetical protein
METKPYYVIVLEEHGNKKLKKPVYVADWSFGDPPRTYLLKFAHRFKSKWAAKKRLNEIIKAFGRGFANAQILEIQTS